VISIKYLIFLPALLAVLPDVSMAGSMSDYQGLKSWCIGRNKWDDEGRKTPYPHPDQYFHYHHYCGAMRWMQNYFKASSQRDKLFAFTNVHNNLDYVISHVPADHFLIPEIYALRGSAYALQGKKAAAETSLYRALQLDPGHVDANMALAKMYVESNRKEKAKELVKNGLAVAPDNKSLLRLAKQLGIPEEEIKAAVDAASKKAAQVTGKEAPQESAASEPVVAKEADQAAERTPAEPVNQPKIGSPTNPWCRFCPDPVVKP
jgi:tetratricopeptide (TPR) repeat protein